MKFPYKGMLRYALIGTLLCFLYSCELNGPPPKCVESTRFNHLDPNSAEYEKEVHSLLEFSLPGDYRYFFKTFFDRNDSTYMKVNFRTTDFCFDVDMLVENWDKLGGMKKVNGKSYPSELNNLKWLIQEHDGQKIVVYIDMDTIID